MKNTWRWSFLVFLTIPLWSLGQVQLLPPTASPPELAVNQAEGADKQIQGDPRTKAVEKGKAGEVLPSPKMESTTLNQLCPNQQFIDLPTALQLADAQNPEIGLVRERIREALAQQNHAEVLWLPHLDMGPTWLRHDGQLQRSTGEVLTVSKSSLFVGGGLTLTFQPSNALFANLAARQITAAYQAGAAAVTNQRLLEVALAYLDLLQVYANLHISAESLSNARELRRITEGWEKAEKGFAADTARARTEASIRERELLEAQGQARLASAHLAKLLNLPPDLCFQPLDPAVAPFVLIPEETPLQELLAQGLSNRPEITENRAFSRAAYERWRAAKWAPLVPNLIVGYSAGGFGGGPNEFFGNFASRGDAVAMAAWHLDNLGLGNLANNRERRSQFMQTTYQQTAVENSIAQEIVAAHTLAHVRRQELVSAERAVKSAFQSFQLNANLLRKAPDLIRPIELLQAVQALALSRQAYLQVILDFNRAQFRLYTALGNPPQAELNPQNRIPLNEPVVPAPS